MFFTTKPEGPVDRPESALCPIDDVECRGADGRRVHPAAEDCVPI